MILSFLYRHKSFLLGIVLPACLVGAGLTVALRTESATSSRPSEAALVQSPPAQAGVTSAAGALFAGSVASRSWFAWPATGPLTSYVGPGHPTGIDIGFSYDEDSLVRAAAAGTVTFAGGSPCCDYGLHVEIEHEDGWSTLYAHFSRIGVRAGQYVEQGALLGLGGSTGFSDGKHLHFEIMYNEGYVDPLRFLPPEQVRGRPASPFSCLEAPLTIDPASRAFLNFTSSNLAGFHVIGANIEPVEPGQGEPAIVAGTDGGLDIFLDAEAALTPSGRVYDYNLALSFASESATTEVNCMLRLKTMQSFPTMVRVTRPIATPTRKPTWTPTRVPLTSTPTRVPPAATRTPIISNAAATPRGPLPTSTRAGGGSAATPRPPVAATATPRR
jgi:hypothetical protein